MNTRTRHLACRRICGKESDDEWAPPHARVCARESIRLPPPSSHHCTQTSLEMDHTARPPHPMYMHCPPQAATIRCAVHRNTTEGQRAMNKGMDE
mmetsp:Transcript_29997/g.87047  ORF Transcript_29997/g.87047 Transcript_29997/m.87047 type:complete len:95 (-) Transcript_29997:1088-1372(-)